MDQATKLSLKLDRLLLLHHAGLRRQMRDIGLWRGQKPILEYVLTHEGCTQANLARDLGLSAATVAVSTKRLSRAGLLIKQAREDNLRCNRLFVTESGREKVTTGAALAAEHNRALFSALSEEERETFSDLLDRLISSLGEKAEAPTPLENYILRNKLSEEAKK